MAKAATRWLLTAVPLLLIVSLLTFLLTQLIPGDAARTLLGAHATPAQYDAVRHQLGLDQPVWTQYGRWLGGVLHGDWGTSVTSGDTVWHEVVGRLPVTAWLITGAAALATVLGLLLGVTAALRAGRLGRAVDVLSLAGLAVPNYWLGLVLAALLAVKVQLFPATGYVPLASSPQRWFESLVLPVLTLGLSGTSVIAKQTRDAVRAELDKDYVTALRARGLSERRVIWRHVLRNAAGAIVTVVGLLVVGLLSGTVLVETIFVLPGLGSLAVNSTTGHDLPLVQAIAVLFTVVIVLVNLAVEFAHSWLDPRVRT